jgi:hypothetical protein
MITRVFFIRLGNTNKVSLVDRSVVERVLNEHAFQAGDWSDQQKTAELGTALNADWIVRGEMEKFRTNILVTVQFYDIRTFRFMGGADLRLANVDEAYDKMDPLVDKLVETISGSSASGGRSDGSVSGTGGGGGTPAEFVLVPAGTFSMGGTMFDNEKPVHQVTISEAFSLSDHEVTQKEWVEIMASNPSNWKGDNLPVENVSWYEVIEYCNKRSIREGLTPAYSGSNSVDGMAWYSGNSGNRTHPVRTKEANGLGLYDMSGNVREWCWDWYRGYSGSGQTDPTGAAGGSYRVVRGGSWSYGAQLVRSAYRDHYTPSDRSNDLGFRLVRP